MRIAYCTNVRLPSERAHGHQVAAVCDAIVKLGHQVHIFAPWRKNPITQKFYEYHGVDSRITITHVDSFDGIASPWTPDVLGLKAMTFSYCRKLKPQLTSNVFDLLYTRTPEILGTLLSTGIPVVLELHKLPRLFRSRFVRRCKRCRKVVCLTTPMKNELAQWGVPAEQIIVEGDAVTLERFTNAEECKHPFSSPEGMHVVGYVGSLASMGLEKGIRELIDALVILKRNNENVFGVIVGGPEHYRMLYETYAQEKGLGPKDCLFIGHINVTEVPCHIMQCDTLIYTAPETKHPYFVRDTSPLKIFEYMASEKPIVCADLPPLHDVLDTSTALFFRPGDSADLARKIKNVMKNQQEAKRRAHSAKKHVHHFTWEKRMKRILSSANL